MAITTKANRFSMLSFGDADGALLPDPDANGIEAEDRAHLIWLYGGIALGELVAVVVTEQIGGGKHGQYPPQPLISPRDFRRGWKEHVSSVEKEILAKSVGVEEARQFKIQKDERVAPKKKSKGIQTQKREKAARPDPVNRLEANKQNVDSVRRTTKVDRGIQKPPSEKTLPKRAPKPVRKTSDQLEARRSPAQNPLEAVNAKQKRKAIESRVEKGMVAAEKQERVDAQLAKEAAFKRRKTALVNMEFMKEAQAKKRAVEAVQKKAAQKRMKKVRAAKKRKAKKKK